MFNFIQQLDSHFMMCTYTCHGPYFNNNCVILLCEVPFSLTEGTLGCIELWSLSLPGHFGLETTGSLVDAGRTPDPCWPQLTPTGSSAPGNQPRRVWLPRSWMWFGSAVSWRRCEKDEWLDMGERFGPCWLVVASVRKVITTARVGADYSGTTQGSGASTSLSHQYPPFTHTPYNCP